MTFDGFSRATLSFLQQLEENNDKVWFDAHRIEYERHYIEPAKQFVSAIGEHLKKLAPNVTADPRVNKSIFRINRDIRFSKDKTPYKNHIDLWFYHGTERQGGSSGLYFRLLPHRLYLGAGIHGFDKDGLARYRQAVDESPSGEALTTIVAQLRKKGYGTGGSHYKKVPRGYDEQHPRAELLKHNSLYADLESPLPKELYDPSFIKWCVAHCRKLLPIHEWLVGHLQRG